MDKKIAIKVENISKTFRIPHEKISSLRGAMASLLESRDNGYEEFKALDDVSFEVKKGEFFGIIGRNGSGKSTLLKILAGIYQTDKGKIGINGMISPFLELGIGFNPELSGRDNIYLNATVLGMTKKQIDAKFDSIVVFSELERFIDQKLKNYSSGMQVRLAFSVSIHANRDILLMDEVLAVGDSNFQSKCITEFNRYKNLGRTVVIVTHDISVVERYCDRAMLLRNGKIKKIGKASEIADAYVYQNMSDEERRIRLEDERIKKMQEQEIIQAEKERIKVEKEMKKLKGKKLEEEKNRVEKERKQQEGEKKKQEEAQKNRVVEITGVEFLDKEGKKKNVFQTGDDMSIKVYFKKNKEVPLLNFGLGIYNQENFYFAGFSTIRDRVDTRKFKQEGYYQVNLKNIPFNENLFYLKLNVAGDDLGNHYDYIDRSRETFRVFSPRKNPGNISFNYNWG